MGKPGWGPLLPLQGDARNSDFWRHGQARLGPPTTPTGGRAEFRLLETWASQVGAPYYPYRGTRGIQTFGDMAKPGWGPLLPLQGDARNSDFWRLGQARLGPPTTPTGGWRWLVGGHGLVGGCV